MLPDVMDSSILNTLIRIYRELEERINPLRFSAPVTHVYNPLAYAWKPFTEYLRLYAHNKKRIIFVGMNPGPWGMVQTGVPFGDVGFVKNWLQISASVAQPQRPHPKRVVHGFSCRRGEVSGRRLWQLFKDRYGTPQRFFSEQFVANYCPLAFFDVAGRNITPDHLGFRDRDQLVAVCDISLAEVVKLLQPEWIIGIGKFVETRLKHMSSKLFLKEVKTAGILHPSPANPRANKNWGPTVSQKLIEIGAWH